MADDPRRTRSLLDVVRCGAEHSQGFLVRTELHCASDEDYQKLHTIMEDNGFTRVVQWDDGLIYDLPEGEYIKPLGLTSQQVTGMARGIAATTGLKFGMIVTEIKSFAMYGLEQNSGQM